MELKGSSPCSEQLPNGPYPEPDESSIHLPPYFTKIRSNIILSPRWCLPSGVPTKREMIPKQLYFPLSIVFCFLQADLHPTEKWLLWISLLFAAHKINSP
jgi:hypothetical protein